MLFTLSLLACKAPTETPEDADGDGFVADDCDDTNPLVYPGAMDLWNDDLDADCDGEDRRVYQPADLSVRVESDEWYSFVICDLTDDGQDDLAIGKTDDVLGRIWYVIEGPLQPGVIEPEDKVAVLQFKGIPSRLQCADFTGDGRADLATADGSFDEILGVTILPQPEGGFLGDVGPESWLEYPIEEAVVYDDVSMSHADIDGDGVQDFFFSRYQAGTPPHPGVRTVDFVLGGAHEPQPFLDLAQPMQFDLSLAYYLPKFIDLDGDSEPEQIVCAPDICHVLQGYPMDGSPIDAYELGSFAAPGISSPAELALGDYDGDGSADDLAAASWAGGVVFYANVMENLTSRAAITPSAVVQTVPAFHSLANLGDLDGDGADDVSAGWDGGIARVISGRLAMAGVAPAGADEELASLFKVAYEDAAFGSQVTGDLDGDGIDEVLFDFSAITGAQVGSHLSSHVARGTPLEAPVETEGGCDYTEILGTWRRTQSSPFGEATNTLVFDVSGPLQPGDAAGQLEITFEEAEPCRFALECSVTDIGHRTWARLAEHNPGLVCASGWTDWFLQSDGTLHELYSATAPGGEAITLSIYEPVTP